MVPPLEFGKLLDQMRNPIFLMTSSDQVSTCQTFFASHSTLRNVLVCIEYYKSAFGAIDLRRLLLSFIVLFLFSIVSPVRAETSWKVGAASVAMAAEDSMVIGGGIGPGFVQGQEGFLQATAIVIRSDKQLCLISA